MGWHAILTGRAGHALLAGLALGCAGADQPLSGPAKVVTEIPPERQDRRPRFVSLAPRLAHEGEPYRYGISVLDPMGEEVRLTLVRAPEGAELHGAVLVWTPAHAQAGRPQRFTLRAADADGATTQTWMVIPGAEPHGRR